MKKVISHKVYEAKKIENFRELVQQTVEKYPENIAYKFKKIEKEKETYVNISYHQLKQNIEEFSSSLLQLGLEGKRIAIIANNCYEWCVTYLAVTTGNMVIVPLDKALPDNEIESLIIRSGVEAIVFEEKYEEVISKTKNSGKSQLQYLIQIESKAKDGIMPYSDLIEKGKQLLQTGDSSYQQVKIDNEKMSIMLFTSGTTSIAKAVMLSQKNICSNIEAIASHVQLYPTDTLLSFLPLHHTFESTITFLWGLYFGVTVAFCDGLKHIQKNLKEYEITVFVAVPLVLETMYKKIRKAIEEQGKTKLIDVMSKVSNTLLKCKIDIRKTIFKPVLEQLGGKLRVVLYGAAPMDRNTIVGYNNLGIDLIQGYGLTETSPVIATETDKEKMPGSVGYPLYNLEVKIQDPDKDGIGEIVVKGPSVMLGYLDNQEATDKVLKDGWFSTGDYGYLDEKGMLYVTGRKSDVIVLTNGKNIYPQEIEFLIGKLSYVVESMVYARNKNVTDTSLAAKIVYDEEHIVEALGEKTQKEYQEEIWKRIKEINQTLPDYKHIKEISITKEPLIKTTTQKVKRFQEMKKIEA